MRGFAGVSAGGVVYGRCMSIIPDDKNWTWVLERACPDCGFDASTFEAHDISRAIVANAATWKHLLAAPNVGSRPVDAQWSALEYGCHVRDVFRLFDHRLRLMLELDNPTYANWDQDQTALDEDYGSQDPAVVERELTEAAASLAHRFDSVSGAEWLRTGVRSDGARFTVASFAKYLIHDPVHHVYDVESGYQRMNS